MPAALVSVVFVVAACGWEPPLEASPSPPPASGPASASPSSAAESEAPSSPVAPSSAVAPTGSTATAGDFLVTLGYRGGHCRTGPCDRTVAIDREGGVHQVAPEEQALGQIPPELFAEVREQLSLADFDALGSRPFTGECPVNFDGQEHIYTFHGATGDITLASCAVELDPSDPLFIAIESALAAVPAP